jgi:gluconokinase
MVVILMGVSGAGKSTIGEMLASQLGWRFYDADDLHPDANKRKMSHAIPLTDKDRRPWLAAVRALVARCLAEGVSAVIACSALKQSYRELLAVDPAAVKFVYLRGDRALITERMAARRAHFMSAELLQSQFDTLEEPRDGITVDIAAKPEEIVASIRRQLGL